MDYISTEHYDLQQVNSDEREKLRDERIAWKVKRMGANRLKKLYEAAGYGDYAERVSLCAMWFKFGQFPKEPGNLEKLERHTLSDKPPKFCNLRLCPICIARRARARGRILSRVMDGVQVEHKCQYLFLTLALRNVTGDKLEEAIDQLTEGWRRLINQRPVARAFKGTFRAIEITRNNNPKSKWYGTYHPHIHAILAVDGDYRPSNPLYLKQSDLVARWRKAARVDYDPTVNIKATYEKGKKKGQRGDDAASRGAVLEAAKYSTKDSDYISDKLSDEEGAQVVGDYTHALDHRRLTSFTGWMKETAARLKVEDLEKADLDDERGKFRSDLAVIIEEYGWHFGAGDYILAKRYVNPLYVKREEGKEDAGK